MTPCDSLKVFSANLEQLCQEYGSLGAVARDLGISRTMLNRYRHGESNPRADVLRRICDNFGVDANILFVPLDELPAQAAKFLLNEEAVQDVLNSSENPAGALQRIANSRAVQNEGAVV